jgi:hypothetical protein
VSDQGNLLFSFCDGQVFGESPGAIFPMFEDWSQFEIDERTLGEFSGGV